MYSSGKKNATHEYVNILVIYCLNQTILEIFKNLITLAVFTRFTNLLLKANYYSFHYNIGLLQYILLKKTTILLVAPDPPSRGIWDIWGRCRRWRSGSMYGSVLTYAQAGRSDGRQCSWALQRAVPHSWYLSQTKEHQS